MQNIGGGAAACAAGVPWAKNLHFPFPVNKDPVSQVEDWLDGANCESG